jgi:hypothetical protein
MPGRPEFSQAGTNGGGQKVAVSNRPEIEKITVEKNTTIPADGDESVEIYAPPGSIYEVITPYLFAPGPGGTSGTHQMNIRGASLPNGQAIRATSEFGDDLRFQFSTWVTASNGTFPTTEMASLKAFQSIVATEDEPILIQYSNETDSPQESRRNYNFTVREQSY